MINCKICIHKKYDAATIFFQGAGSKFDGAEILDINETEYEYRKAVVKLTDEQIKKFKSVQDDINDFLVYHDYPTITIVYKNKMYAKN